MKKLFIIFCFFAIVVKLYSGENSHYKASLSNIFTYQNQKDLLLVGAIALPLSFLLDSQVKDYAVKKGFYSDEISKIGDIYGHRVGYFAVAGSMLLADFIMKKEQAKSLAEIRLVAEGVLAGQLVIESLKLITHRKRPNGKSYKSFPSGHAGGAFGLATTLQHIYGKKIGIPAYLMAFFVASSRINDNKHYLSDVVAGSLIGGIVARGFATHYRSKWEIKPDIFGPQRSINLNICF